MSLFLEYKNSIVDLTGQQIPFSQNLDKLDLARIFSQPVGYSQFNEILLTLGYDRISSEFFQFLIDGQIEYDPRNPYFFNSKDTFLKGVARFRKLALLVYGNIKYAFKRFSSEPDLLFEKVSKFEEVPEALFFNRPAATIPLKPIPASETYYLGYMIQKKITKQLELNPNDKGALAEQVKIKTWCDVGKDNHYSYLTSDYLDVYVATSMRERHEFVSVFNATQAIFNHPLLSKLNIRYFDPTQAYCKPRIDKGLSEALMLKRAQLTIYLVQETDTLGKDSELASTLAQGKPVVAYIPEVTPRFFEEFLQQLEGLYSLSLNEIIVQHLEILCPKIIWDSKKYPNSLADIKLLPLDMLKKLLFEKMKELYDSRADALTDSHPLGIQVHLEDGVANGVLVVRSINDCAALVKSILLNNIDVYLDKVEIQGSNFLVLKEQISNCIFRVESSDEILTNSFWNFYLY
jgi:hypothetical protein